MILLSLGWLTGVADARPPRACWVPSRLLYVGRSSLLYTTPEDAQVRENEAAALERREPRAIRAGWLAVEVDRTTLDGADPRHQLVIVSKDGEEILRYEPESEIPEANPETPGFWYAYAVVQLPEGVAPPLQVDVIDRLQQAACAWTVDAEGEVTLEQKRKTGD